MQKQKPHQVGRVLTIAIYVQNDGRALSKADNMSAGLNLWVLVGPETCVVLTQPDFACKRQV